MLVLLVRTVIDNELKIFYFFIRSDKVEQSGTRSYTSAFSVSMLLVA